MATSTITVAEVHQPPQGKKKGIVIDAHGDKYFVWPDKLPHYQPGSVYEITYTVSAFNNAQIRNIDSARRSQAAPEPIQPRATQGAGGNTYRQTSEMDAKRMWMTAIVQRGVQSGQVQYNDEALYQAGVDALKAWDALQPHLRGETQPRIQTQNGQNQQTQQARRDLDDDIPF